MDKPTAQTELYGINCSRKKPFYARLLYAKDAGYLFFHEAEKFIMTQKVNGL